MIQDSVIPSVEIAHKLNLWYLSILNYEEDQARAMQTEIQSLLGRMEEDQNVLLYYSLLDFRFRINYDAKENLQHYHQQLEDAAESSDTLSLPINYYYCLFSGDYEFRKGNLLRALSYYRHAINRVRELDDEIELAQCYYHLSEVYAKLSYSVISVIYAQTALRIFDKYPEFVVFSVHCRNIYGTNLVNDRCYDYAGKLFSESHALSKKISNNRLSAIAAFNMGIVHMHLNDYKTAEACFHDSLVEFVKESDRYIPRAYCSYYECLAEQGKFQRAKYIYNKGICIAFERNDLEYLTKLSMLHLIYEEPLDIGKVEKCISELLHLHLNNEVMDFTLRIAEKFKNSNDKDSAIKYYELSNNVRIHIIEGEGINENDLQNNWDTDINTFASCHQ
ncbi:MAG: hypothetical protein ABF969_05510 [Sporolactobacillus sp.]